MIGPIALRRSSPFVHHRPHRRCRRQSQNTTATIDKAPVKAATVPSGAGLIRPKNIHAPATSPRRRGEIRPCRARERTRVTMRIARLTASAGRSRRSFRRKLNPNVESSATTLGILTQHTTHAKTPNPPTMRAVFVFASGRERPRIPESAIDARLPYESEIQSLQCRSERDRRLHPQFQRGPLRIEAHRVAEPRATHALSDDEIEDESRDLVRAVESHGDARFQLGPSTGVADDVP